MGGIKLPYAHPTKHLPPVSIYQKAYMKVPLTSVLLLEHSSPARRCGAVKWVHTFFLLMKCVRNLFIMHILGTLRH